MNYNLKVEMERVNNNVVTQVEVSGIGRAGRKRLVSPDFDTALVDLKKAYDELLSGVEAYHAPTPQVSVAETAPAPAKSSGKKSKKAPAKPKAKPSKKKALAKPARKRSFAAE